MTPQKISSIFKRFHKANPRPTTELKYSSPFELLIAVILSARTTDKGVNKATQLLFAAANTPEKILALGETGLQKYIKSIGLYKTKGKNILVTCQLLLDQHEGQVPNDRQALEALPGVGRKTANVILNTAFGHPTIAVDTHIFRVAQRIGLAKGKTPLAIENQLLQVIPKKYIHDAHHWLILHGRYVCKAPTPLCPQCLICDLCEFTQKTGPCSK